MKTPYSRSDRTWRLALFAYFFVIGIGMASWVTRTPALRDQLEASIGEMGLVLFGLSIGSMSGLISASSLIRRVGTRAVSTGGLLCVALGVAVIGCGAWGKAPWVVFVGLFLFGVGMGTSEISINIDAVEVERRLARPVLAMLHGCFSLGTFCGALLGIALNAAEVPIHWHLISVSAAAAIAILCTHRLLPVRLETTSATDASSRASSRPASLWSDRRLLMIGLIIMAMALAEGTANDWLPLLMVDEHGFDPTSGALIYGGFALGMTMGRFCGTLVLRRVGRGLVVRLSTLACTIGLALAIFAHHPVLAAASVIFWGLGASLGFPLAISAAGDSDEDSARRVGFVATAGYFSFLVGPPMLGYLGEHHGLRSALIVVLVLAALSVFMAQATDVRTGPR